MIEKTTRKERFNWQLSLYLAIGAFIVFISLVVYSGEWGDLFYLFIVVPIASLTLLIIAVCKKGQKRLSMSGALIVYLAISGILFVHSFGIRSAGRWFLWSRDYKAEVLAQPSPENGELKHIEWDGWGWAGSDTYVYLVFDPNDSLAQEIKSHSKGKFSGIPCEVANVHRLSNHWYSVVFYTDTQWGRCN